MPRSFSEADFCCGGCAAAWEILHANGLDSYYALLASGDEKPVPVTPSGVDFGYLDDPAFRAAQARHDGRTMDFYLEGVHCAACVWLVEKLPSMVPGVDDARLDLGRARATVRLGEAGSFAQVAAQLDRLGYRPHAVREDEAARLQQAENRRLLMRIGVAATVTMNLMLLAIALYAGVAGELADIFTYLSAILFLPVLFYSAVPFYRSAWGAARSLKMSIDVPVVLGIAIGAAVSYWNLLAPATREHVYFDSLATLVFLLLGSRYLMRRAQESALARAGVLHNMLPASVRRWSADAGGFVSVPVESVRRGDRVEVRVGEVFPVDGRIVAGRTRINAAVLTGESRLQEAGENTPVFSGTVNEGAAVEVEVLASGAETRVGQIVAMVEEAQHRRPRTAAVADRIAGWFTLAVLVVGAATFLFWIPSGADRALNHVMALFIVTCPCALAMSAPVAMLVSMGRAARLGMIIKGPDVFEKLAAARTLYLDKTGTLTQGAYRVLRWEFSEPDEEPRLRRIAYELERRSNHPVARALLEDLLAPGSPPMGAPVPVTGAGERIGEGVYGEVDGVCYALRRDDAAGTDGAVESGVALLADERVVARIRLGDRLRDDAGAMIERLREAGMRPRILSGDSAAYVAAIAGQVGIVAEDRLAGETPESKQARLAADAGSVMVGDGANDSGALATAAVGIAVHGGMEISLRAADVFLTRPGLAGIATLVRGSRETMQVIRRNLLFSLVYNLIGAGLAVAGIMSPLGAAVLMPLSSFTILGSSVLGARSFR